MTDERFFALARLHGFPPDRALREFAECIEAEVATYWADGDEALPFDRMRDAIAKATGEV